MGMERTFAMDPQERRGPLPFFKYATLEEPRCCSLVVSLACNIMIRRGIRRGEPILQLQTLLFCICFFHIYSYSHSGRHERQETVSHPPSMSPATLSSTLCVTFRVSVIAIRASSMVSVSSLFSASSTSFRPSSFLTNFSKESKTRVNNIS
jgi:hypothetical protein